MPIVEHPESMPLAAKLYQQAAVKGYPSRTISVGLVFLNTDVVWKSMLLRHSEWYQVSAKREDVAALTPLVRFTRQTIVPQTKKDKSVKFIQQAAIAEWTQEAEYWLSKHHGLRARTCLALRNR